jgi:uncharacterized protein YegP (UPF0339 family)
VRIEVFKRKSLLGKPKWYFRIRASNGEPIAQSEGYSRRLDAVSTAQSLKNSLSLAEIHDA